MDIFTNKTAIVTGGASGIGLALCRGMARRGARVIMADLNAALLQESALSISGQGLRVEAVTLDVTDPVAVKNLVDDTVSRYGQLDYLFNNAGVVVACEAQDHPYDEWRRVIETNLFGVINGVAAAYPVMVKQGSGHIVNTGSLAGLVPSPGEISYTTSKYGVVGLSNALRVEGAIYGVKVSVVCPGFVRTPIFDNARTVKLNREKLLAAMPKGMDPEACARVILRGVERNRAIIPVSSMASIFWFVQRLSPWFVRMLLGLMMRRSIHAAKMACE